MRIAMFVDYTDVTQKVMQATKLIVGSRVPAAEIDVFHIIDTSLLAAAVGDEPHIVEELEQNGKRIYDMGVEYLGANFKFIEEYGIPQPQIDSILAEGAYDLVITGSRGRSVLAGALLGSVSEHVLHHAHMPVLIVPA